MPTERTPRDAPDRTDYQADEPGAAANGSDAEDHEPEPRDAVAMVEPDTPPTSRIFILMGLLTVVVILVVVGLWQAFTVMVRDRTYERELSLKDRQLEEIQAQGRERLTTYAVIDAEKGVYQVPIERAMRKLLAHPELIARPPLAGSPSTMPASAPATKPAATRPAHGESTR